MKPWDIFCQVVDNFGDAGVCWRLARQLAAEHQLPVRLWVDDLGVLAPLAPGLQSDAASQVLSGVEVRAWPRDWVSVEPGAVVIEAFGCALPDSLMEAMARREPSPVWINLEYLSAEAWVDEHHGLPSRHPRLPLTKFFFFPGFTAKTGGLLREHGLLAARDAFQGEGGAPAAFWRSLGLVPPEGARRISMFCYPEAPLAELFAVWAQGAEPVFCAVPEGPIARRAGLWLGHRAWPAGTVATRGNLSLGTYAFLPQELYDRLLWACDFNFVRGEDSFVRAQWAAKPMVWQPYRQSEEAHAVKLAAFLARQAGTYPATAAQALANFTQAWNRGGELASAWTGLAGQWAPLAAGAANWADSLARQADLARQLVDFAKKQAIMRGSSRL